MTLEGRLQKLEQKHNPPPSPVIKVAIVDQAAGTVQADGETMTMQEYNRRYPTGPKTRVIRVGIDPEKI